jgi:hypothetical protein
MGTATATRVAAGEVCIAGLPFTPNNVQATLSVGANVGIADKGQVVLAGIVGQVAAPFGSCTTAGNVWLVVDVNGAQVDGWSLYLIFQ